MKLSVSERLTLLTLLPAQGDLTTIRIVRQLREELSFDEVEHERLQFHPVGEQLSWRNEDADGNKIEIIKDVEIGARATGLIADALLELNKQKKIRVEHLSLFDKFKVEEG